jgi:hypothetical protein
VHADPIRQAAQGKVLYADDTTMRMSHEAEPFADDDRESNRERRGTFTSGIVSTFDGPYIARFLTGRRHAGETPAGNLAHLAGVADTDPDR